MKRIIMLIILLSFILIGCSVPNQNVEDYGLSSIKDSNELNKLIEKSKPRQSFNWFSEWFSMAKDSNIDESSVDDYESSDYTKTNVQVDGVDEGDIMKTDGSRIYSISWDRLQVINLLGDGKMEVLLNERIISETMENEYYYHDIYYSDLYLTDDFLVVIGQKYDFSPVYYEDDATNNKAKDLYYYSTITSFINIYDKDSLEKVDFYEISGGTLGSRLINNNLYLIANYPIYNFGDDDYDIRPWFKHNDETKYFDYEDIKYIPDSTHRTFTIISTITLETGDISYDNNIFLSTSWWGEIYVSTKSIYLACNYYEYSLLGNGKSIGLLVSFQFDEETGKVSFGGYANYEGAIINQFAIDEYNGYIRIATTEGWGNNVKNRLYIFKREFKDDIYSLSEISLLDKGLGKPGERIQSVRFNKDIATIVTFLQTDPFYTINLSDPYNPVIAGELEIPGFSTYQHPWTDNLIIGIGFDADNFGRTSGIKISLYDITDIDNPIEVGKPLIFSSNQSGYSYSESTYNHKAIMIDKSRNCIGIPLTSNKWSYQSNTKNEYLILDIDETRDQPIQIKHTLTHDDYYQEYNHLYQYKYYWAYNFNIKRAFRVDNYLYLLSGEVITSHNLLGDLTVVDEIIFEQSYLTE